MEKPNHILSFSVSYPVFKDYYLYRKSRQKKPNPAPEWFLAAGVTAAVSAFLLQSRMGVVVSSPAFLLLAGFAVLCVPAYFICRAGWVLWMGRRGRLIWQVTRLGKRPTEIRFYEKEFSVHYPHLAFDGTYDEIQRVDHTRRSMVFCFPDTRELVIPKGELTAETISFLNEKTPDGIFLGAD